MQTLYAVLAIVAAYLLGSLAFAVIVSKAMGLSDPRTFGSKNPGATNVLRSGSKAAAIVTLLLDAMKGLVPVLLVKHFGQPWGLEEGTMDRPPRPAHKQSFRLALLVLKHGECLPGR